MAAQTQALTVPFHGNTLYVVNHNNEPYAPMKPIVEGMELDWGTQFRKIAQGFASTIVEMTIVAEDGKKRLMTCLPLRKLPGWLYTVSVNKVRPECREKVAQYQTECDDVLWRYWTQGQAINPRSTVDERTPLRAAVDMLVGKKSLLYPDAYSMVHQRFGVTSIEQLQPEQIPQAVEYLHRLVLEGEVLPAEKKWLVEDLPAITLPPLDNMKGTNSWLTYSELLRIKRLGKAPISVLLRELSLRGYDVSAARLEYDGWRHCLEMANNSLESITMSANILNGTGLPVHLYR